MYSARGGEVSFPERAAEPVNYNLRSQELCMGLDPEGTGPWGWVGGRIQSSIRECYCDTFSDTEFYILARDLENNENLLLHWLSEAWRKRRLAFSEEEKPKLLCK